MTTHARTRPRLRPQGRTLLPAPALWTKDAVCTRVGTPADWSPEAGDTEAVKEALQACGHCPVRRECLEDALSRPAKTVGTIRGGLTEDQRKTERRRRRQQGAAGRTMHDALEATRMVRAVAADGHPTGALQARAQVSHSTLTGLRTGTATTVASDVAARIRAAYQHLSQRRPPAGAHATRTRRHAAAQGWATSAAWAGLDMADPNTQPATVEARIVLDQRLASGA